VRNNKNLKKSHSTHPSPRSKLQQAHAAAMPVSPKPAAESKPLPESLPVKRDEILPDQDDLVCAIHGCEKKRIGEEVTEYLEFVAASFYRQQIARPKFACDLCEGNIVIADLPARPIDKGLDINRSTMCHLKS
jgi:transposase